VALVDERDGLAAKAARDLKRLRTGPFASTGTVLGEACFLLPHGYQRKRLRALLDRLAVAIVEVPSTWWDETFDWLDRYAEHEPDLADAQLAVLCSRKPDWRIWTYDREFRTTWRRANGSRLPLVGATAVAR
jgi:predicted nucleic acid-binding protein